jgi:hypothetical protein
MLYSEAVVPLTISIHVTDAHDSIGQQRKSIVAKRGFIISRKFTALYQQDDGERQGHFLFVVLRTLIV